MNYILFREEIYDTPEEENNESMNENAKIKKYICNNFEKIYNFCFMALNNTFSLEISRLSLETMINFLKEKNLSFSFQQIIEGLFISAFNSSYSLIIAKSIEGLNELLSNESMPLSNKISFMILEKILMIWTKKKKINDDLEYVIYVDFIHKNILYFRKYANF